MCVVLKVLAHSSLKKAKLCRHLEANHKKFVNKNLDVFKEKEHQVKRSRIDCPAAWGGVAYSHNKAVRASSFVSWKIVREKAPHTAVENFIKPVAVEMARILYGDAVAYKLAMVFLSNDTIKWRIQEISEDVLQQTIASVKRSGKFSLQLDETIDIGNDAQLMMCVTLTQTTIWSSFCFAVLLPKIAGEQIFKKVNLFFKKHQLQWSDCVSVCEDGATSMMGCKKGFMSFVKKENKNISVVHCLIQRENLTAKEIQGDLP